MPFIRLALAFVAISPIIYCQTASVTGQIKDPSGAAVPDVKITLTAIETGRDTVVRSTSEGYYTAPSLPPGAYRLLVEAKGFRPVVDKSVSLEVQQVARLDFTLQLGELASAVEVSAEAPILDSQTATLGQVVGTRQIIELPLLGRNPYALAGLVPGVRISSTMNDLPVDQISTASASINGGRGNQNEFLLDGAPNTASAQNQPIIYANPDTVQEFKVETNAFSAEYGRASGGIFNVITKSGTNGLHFSAYEFLRNDKLNASDWFANRAGQPKPPFRFNQFGGTLGGPVVLPHLYDGHNKTFFFLSTELVRFTQGVSINGTVPQPQQLLGDFSHALNSNGALIRIYNPFTTRLGANGAYVRDPFPNNVIPPSLIDPIARNISKYWPAPDTPGNPVTGQNNFSLSAGNGVMKNTWSARIDHNFRESDRLYGRFSFDDSPSTRAPAYGPGAVASPTPGPQIFRRINTVVEETHLFSATLLSTFRVSFARLSNFRHPYGDGFDITKLGFPAGLQAQIGAPAAFPSIMVNGMGVTASISNTVVGGALGNTGLIAFGMDNYAAQAQIVKTLAQHSLKIGGEYRAMRFNTTQTGDSSTQFSFGPAFTQGPNPTVASNAAGSGLATFLLGLAGGSVTPSPALAMQMLYYGAYVQDEWKVTRRLTVNAGLRYDFEGPRTDRFNQFTNFDFAAVPPLQAPGLNLHGALSFVGVNGQSRFQSNPKYTDFAPRLGIAYSVDPKTVIRAGAGLFYGSTTGIGGAPNGFGISGFGNATNILNSLDGVTPAFSLANPYPDGLNRATGSSLGSATLLGQDVNFFDRGNAVPYSEQWNFDLQHEFPGAILLDAGYAGSHGLKLTAERRFNQLPDSALALGDALRTQVANPFFGQIAVGALAQKTITRAQLLRPFPQFGNVIANASTWGSSGYNALQVKVEKRYAKGLNLLGSYTYSKLIDYETGTFSGEALGGGAIQNWNYLRAERAVSSLDETHRLVMNAVYALPFTHGLTGWKNRLFDGWEAGVIASLFSGSPLGVTSTVNTTFSQGGGQRPNWTGVSTRLDHPTPDRWFDTSQFSAPAPYAFGNAPRTFGDSRNDGTRQVDISFHKNTVVHEHLRLQFRAEAFNLTNTPRFGTPNVAYGNPQFGIVNSQANQSRIIQLALKLLF